MMDHDRLSGLVQGGLRWCGGMCSLTGHVLKGGVQNGREYGAEDMKSMCRLRAQAHSDRMEFEVQLWHLWASVLKERSLSKLLEHHKIEWQLNESPNH